MLKNGPTFLALSCVGFIASAPASADPGTAAPIAAQDRTDGRDDIVVNGTPAESARLESPKSTSALIDLPQTVTVLNDQTIRKQNLQTLRDALQTIPGITFGAGEGGGGYGDNINLRGYSATNDITVDGVRDSGQYSRTDPFDLQQIEVYNGANSVFNGSGSVGGTINLVSKVPTPRDLTVVQGSIGTDDYYRAAIDANKRVGNDVAVRLNAAYHRNDVPGRDVERFERWGVAPAVTIGIDGSTSLTLAYVHQEDDNTPYYGVPFFRTALSNGLLPGADRSAYYGIVNLDRQDQVLDRATATFRHAVSEAVSVRNLTRWQHVVQNGVTSAPQGTFCLAGVALQPNGAACPAGLAPGEWRPSGPRGLVRDQEAQLLYNQTDLRVATGAEGGVRNTLNLGFSGTIEDYAITTASLLRNADGSAVTPLPVLSIGDPDTTWRGPIRRTVTAQARGETRNLAVYAFDTLELGRFVELNGGVRWETQHATFRNLPLAVVPPGATQVTELAQRAQQSRERLFSYRGGVVLHPVQQVSVYASYGNAKTPSSTTVRLGCGAPVVQVIDGAAVTYDPCQVAPETARNYEAGVKASVFGRLELTAAVFRNERTNYRVPSVDPALPSSTQVLDGRSRVDGVALGASGAITPAWTIFANYTYLNGTIRQSVSDRCLAAPSTTCGNSAAVPDPQRGSRLTQTPEHSGSLFTTYRLPFGLELGYGLTYQGGFAIAAASLAAPAQPLVDDYLIHRAYLAYTFADGLTAQLNVQNVGNERYYTGVRNNGWAVPGDARSAVLSLFYNF